MHSLRTSRRRVKTLIGAALAATLLIAGCGASNSDSSDAADDERPPLPAAEGSVSYPLTLETPYGETVLEERPETLAILGGNGELEAAISLGAFPVISPWDGDDWAWLAEPFGDYTPETLNPWDDEGLPFETLAAEDPDLIIAITYPNLQNDFERLSSIAPVLGYEEATDAPWEADWQDITRTVGGALDLSERAGEVITETEQHVTQAAADHPEYAGNTISIVINRGQEIQLELVNWHGSRVERLLNDLGFAQHPHGDEVGDFGDVSLENLRLIDADALVLAHHGGEGTTEESRTWLESSELYQSLDVVERDKVAVIEPSEDGTLDIAWAFAHPNALSIVWTVDELNSAFEGLFDE